MKIAVTASNGQLGTAIVQALIQEIGKEHVIGIARTPEKAQHLEVEIRKGDYDKKADFIKALSGVDKVVIISSNTDPEIRITQHRNIIEAAKDHGLQKIVYTSIVGEEKDSAFSHIVQCNRQSEQDLMASGLNWAIGRNGIYIEPDLEAIQDYVNEGGITNSASEGKCGYTCRPELGLAYAHLVLKDSLPQQVYTLLGEPITQAQLAQYINEVYGTTLTYHAISVEKYTEQRKKALGEFFGTIIGGIYESMKNGTYNLPSDFEQVVGRPHLSAREMIRQFKRS